MHVFAKRPVERMSRHLLQRALIAMRAACWRVFARCCISRKIFYESVENANKYLEVSSEIRRISACLVLVHAMS